MMTVHSHKILTIQQGEPCYLSIWSNLCTLHNECQADRASSWNNSATLTKLSPVDACRGFPIELTPQGQPCFIVGIWGECIQPAVMEGTGY